MSTKIITLLTDFGTYVSATQGDPLVASLPAVGSTEFFEYCESGNTLSLVASNENYVTLQDDGSLVANTKEKSAKNTFEFVINNKSFISLKAANGKYVSAFPDESIKANADSVGPREKFSYHTYNKNPAFYRRSSDIAIIGGGIAGAYIAYRLLANNPNLTISVFEARNRVSGRLLSYPSEDPKVEDELGGMRIFPESQVVIARLLEHLNMTIQNGAIQIRPLADADNYFYAQGKQYIKKDFTVDREINGKKATLSDIDKAAWDQFVTRNPNEPKEQKDAWNSTVLGQISHDEFYRTYGFSRQELELFKAWSGYDLYPEEISAAGYHAHAVLYGSALNEQKFVRDGYGVIVKALFSALDDKYNFQLNMSTVITGIQNNSDPKGRKLILSIDEEAEPFQADHVFITTTLLDAKRMKLNAIPRQRIAALSGIVSLPLFKIFLLYNNEWWLKPNSNTCTGGKSTTDLPIRQIHYYGEKTLLVYNSGSFATYWHEKFSEDINRTLKEILEQVLEVHGLRSLPEGTKLERFRYKYWPSGSHKWAKGTDFENQLKYIQLGTQGTPSTLTHNNVYFAGDTFSLEQGWVEGALTSAENILTHAFNLKPWKEESFDDIHKVFPIIDLARGLTGTNEERYYQSFPDFSNTLQLKPSRIQGENDPQEQDADEFFKQHNVYSFSTAKGKLSFENADEGDIEYVMIRTQNPEASPKEFSFATSNNGEAWVPFDKVYEFKRPGNWGVFKLDVGKANFVQISVTSNYNANQTEINLISFLSR